MSIIYSNGSVTHTFGNVACLAMNYVKKYFPEDYFNVCHISTKLAYKQLDIFKSNKEFWKLKKPILIMRPRVEMDDSSKYFYGAAYMNKMHNVASPMEFSNNINLVKDTKRGVSIDFLWNRYKIYYDTVLIVNTYNEQLNLVNHLLNSIVPNTPLLLTTPLESYVPSCIIDNLFKYLDMDKSKTGEIVNYLNSYSKVPFTYKFKNGAGHNEFFALYGTNVELISSDFSMDDGEQRNMLTDTFTVSFTLSCGFNSMAAFYLALRDNSDKFIPYMPDNVDSTNRVDPLYSIPMLLDITLDPGWVVLSAPTYFISSIKEPDVTNIKEILPDKFKSILKYQKSLNLPEDLFIKFRVFKNNKELMNDETGFKVDLSDLSNPKLITYDLSHNDTYRLFILINNGYINDSLAEITEFNKEH